MRCLWFSQSILKENDTPSSVVDDFIFLRNGKSQKLFGSKSNNCRFKNKKVVSLAFIFKSWEKQHKTTKGHLEFLFLQSYIAYGTPRLSHLDPTYGLRQPTSDTGFSVDRGKILAPQGLSQSHPPHQNCLPVKQLRHEGSPGCCHGRSTMWQHCSTGACSSTLRDLQPGSASTDPLILLGGAPLGGNSPCQLVRGLKLVEWESPQQHVVTWIVCLRWNREIRFPRRSKSRSRSTFEPHSDPDPDPDPRHQSDPFCPPLWGSIYVTGEGAGGGSRLKHLAGEISEHNVVKK